MFESAEQAKENLKKMMGKKGEKLYIELEIEDPEKSIELLAKSLNMKEDNTLFGCKVTSVSFSRLFERTFNENINQLKGVLNSFIKDIDVVEDNFKRDLLPDLGRQIK